MEVAKLASSVKRHLYSFWPLLLIALVSVLYHPTLIQLGARWIQWDESMAHGIPILVLFVTLLYQRRHEFTLVEPPTWERVFAGSALMLGSALWALFYRVNIDILAQLLLLVVMLGGFWFVGGMATVWRHRLLLFLPLFAIPFWDYLNGPLLYVSSSVVGQMVRWVEMPAIIEGSSIFIPHGHILIADGCSGLRYFVVALALGYLVGLLNRYNEGQMLLVLLVAGLLGLITNWVRIFTLVVIGYKTRMQSGLMADHEMFGWLLFALVCLPALYFAPVVKSGVAEVSGHWESRSQSSKRTISMLMVLLVILGTGPMLSLSMSPNLATGPVLQVLSSQPAMRAPLSMPMPVMLPGADLTETSKVSGGAAYIRLDHYQRQSTSDKLVPYMGRLYDNATWRQLESSQKLIGEVPVSWGRYKHKSEDRYVLQSQWFSLGARITDTALAAKLWQIPAMLQGVNEFTVVTIQVACEDPNCNVAEKHMRDHAQRIIEQLNSRKEP